MLGDYFTFQNDTQQWGNKKEDNWYNTESPGNLYLQFTSQNLIKREPWVSAESTWILNWLIYKNSYDI